MRVLVTGANRPRGLGYAIAQRLVRDGHDVWGTYRTDATVPEGVHGVQMDITDKGSVDAAFKLIEETGHVEGLVANAGIGAVSLVPRIDDDLFNEVLNTNLTSAHRLAKRALSKMRRYDLGRIVFIGSAAGLRGAPGQTHYAAAKAGLSGLARAIAKEYGKDRNITANVVSPGYIDTDMLDSVHPDYLAKELATSILGRVAQPHEIAGLLSYLMSEDGGYVTGAVLPVDGGITVR